MAELSRTALKALFATGDIPTGDDFRDLIDSTVNLQDVSAQKFVSNIQAPGVVASTVSAVNIFTDNLFVSGTFTIPTLNTTTLSAQLVQASAVRHKNPYALIYAPGDSTNTIAGASAYAILSGSLSSQPGGLLGFTQNGTTRVTYTGSTTARMMVVYSVDNRIPITICGGGAIDAQMSLFKNSVQLPESRSVATYISGFNANFRGGAITQMKTNDFIELAVKVTAFSTYDLAVRSLNLSIVPVSWEF